MAVSTFFLRAIAMRTTMTARRPAGGGEATLWPCIAARGRGYAGDGPVRGGELSM